jgi:hypothetical protein
MAVHYCKLYCGQNRFQNCSCIKVPIAIKKYLRKSLRVTVSGTAFFPFTDLLLSIDSDETYKAGIICYPSETLSVS